MSIRTRILPKIFFTRIIKILKMATLFATR